jgi:hypothetical protein
LVGLVGRRVPAAFAAIGDIPEAYEDISAALDIDSENYPAAELQARLDKLL